MIELFFGLLTLITGYYFFKANPNVGFNILKGCLGLIIIIGICFCIRTVVDGIEKDKADQAYLIQRIEVFAPDGTKGTIPRSFLQEAKNNGYLTKEEKIQKAEDEKKKLHDQIELQNEENRIKSEQWMRDNRGIDLMKNLMPKHVAALTPEQRLDQSIADFNRRENRN